MKRGIAIGVAASVCIILIALLAFFAVQRRKKIKAQARQSPLVPDIEQEKHYVAESKEEIHDLPISPAPLVEADTRTIYELDAEPMPELPTKDNGRKAQELDGENVGDLKGLPSYESLSRSTPKRSVPVLHISPPESSQLEGMALLGISPAGASPMIVSPLEEVYFPQTPRSPRGWV
jgi:hypothetical protein